MMRSVALWGKVGRLPQHKKYVHSQALICTRRCAHWHDNDLSWTERMAACGTRTLIKIYSYNHTFSHTDFLLHWHLHSLMYTNIHTHTVHTRTRTFATAKRTNARKQKNKHTHKTTTNKKQQQKHTNKKTHKQENTHTQRALPRPHMYHLAHAQLWYTRSCHQITSETLRVDAPPVMCGNCIGKSLPFACTYMVIYSPKIYDWW